MIGDFSPARVFARNYMPTYLSLGFSSRAIQKDLIGRFGEAYRFQNIQADMRWSADIGKKEKMLDRLDISKAVPISAMNETVLSHDAYYKVYGQANFIDVNTGEVVSKRVSFFTDVNEGIGSFESLFSSKVDEYEYEEGMEFYSLKVKQIDHMVGAPY
jgi:hypothetical protein